MVLFCLLRTFIAHVCICCMMAAAPMCCTLTAYFKLGGGACSVDCEWCHVNGLQEFARVQDEEGVHKDMWMTTSLVRDGADNIPSYL